MIECMALQPEYQRCAQHRILQADVGVITNVRHDHADVMGDSLPEIAGYVEQHDSQRRRFIYGR